MLARDAMTTKLIAIGENTPTPEAARLVTEHDVSALPVVDEAGRLVGILSEADLLRRKEIGARRRRPGGSKP